MNWILWIWAVMIVAAFGFGLGGNAAVKRAILQGWRASFLELCAAAVFYILAVLFAYAASQLI